MVLIKSVLSAIPVYYLSFFKAPTCIISKLESLFKQLLWGGDKEERKINWVNWDKMCKPLEDRGLGLKNLKSLTMLYWENEAEISGAKEEVFSSKLCLAGMERA